MVRICPQPDALYQYLLVTIFLFLEAAMGIQIDAQLNSDSEYITAIDK